MAAADARGAAVASRDSERAPKISAEIDFLTHDWHEPSVCTTATAGRPAGTHT